MLTVRFPNGQTVQYNEGWFVEQWGQRNILIKDKKEGKHIAIVSVDCALEWEPACRVYDALKNEPDEQILKELKSINRRLKKMENTK
jgi:hypothetical protein